MLEAIAARIGVVVDDAVRKSVASEKLRMVWSHAAVGSTVAAGFALVMAYYFSSVVAATTAAYWVGAKVFVTAGRIAQAHWVKLHGYVGGSAMLLGTYASLATDGAVFGVAGAYLVGFDLGTAATAIGSLCGIAGVAAFGFQVDKNASAAYISPILVPTAVGCLARGDAFGIYSAVGLGFFLLPILLSSRRTEAKLSEIFLLRIHAAQISAERSEALSLAQRQSAAKTQFLGTVSHELRTPIHGMLGVARLVHVETVDALVRKRMELIESSGTHLLGLVTDLIDVSRIDSGQMRIHRIAFDLTNEIERVADIYAVRAAEKGLAFTLDSQLNSSNWVIGDPVRTRQVLHNLLGNAIKFTNEGWVQLSVQVGSRPGIVLFRIRDTGVGISEEDQRAVFDAFRQVNARRDGRRQGTGLGLTIAQEIARLLGGDVTLQSKLGFGSIFEFCVPFEPAVEPALPVRSNATLADDRELSARILLVEDNDVNFLIASSMLANQGHQVERASDGAEAVRRGLREIDRPDLILMDCMMPEMDGFDATRSIRAQEHAMDLPRVPIIALSAIIDEQMGQRAIDAGMDDTLGKPFSNEDLRRVMRPWLALKESEREGALDQPRNLSVDDDGSAG